MFRKFSFIKLISQTFKIYKNSTTKLLIFYIFMVSLSFSKETIVMVLFGCTSFCWWNELMSPLFLETTNVLRTKYNGKFRLSRDCISWVDNHYCTTNVFLYNFLYTTTIVNTESNDFHLDHVTFKSFVVDNQIFILNYYRITVRLS